MQIANSVATLTNVVNFLTATEQQSIVKPEGFEGSAGFIFDIQEDDSIRLESSITDHFVESNVAISDHIAVKPETIGLKGFMGEVNRGNTIKVPSLSVDEDGNLQADSGFIANVIEEIPDKLVNLLSLAPSLSPGAVQGYNKLQSAIDIASKSLTTAENLYNQFLGAGANPKQTRSAQAFLFFYGLWKAKQIFTVDTPFAVFTNMAIERLEVIQGETKTISDFSISFKKIRFAKTITINSNQQRRELQLAAIADKGRTKGVEVPTPQSTLNALFDGLTE